MLCNAVQCGRFCIPQPRCVVHLVRFFRTIVTHCHFERYMRSVFLLETYILSGSPTGAANYMAADTLAWEASVLRQNVEFPVEICMAMMQGQHLRGACHCCSGPELSHQHTRGIPNPRRQTQTSVIRGEVETRSSPEPRRTWRALGQDSHQNGTANGRAMTWS